jgi:hypothetical protein
MSDYSDANDSICGAPSFQSELLFLIFSVYCINKYVFGLGIQCYRFRYLELRRAVPTGH